MHAKGVVRLPGSKSISNRTLLLAALAEGSTQIKDLLASDDTHVVLMALQKLGIKWEQIGESQDYVIHGVNGVLPVHQRSEEHTSELQSLMRNSYTVFCLKKKNKNISRIYKTVSHIENTTNDQYKHTVHYRYN